jgi:hypothetical protein
VASLREINKERRKKGERTNERREAKKTVKQRNKYFEASVPPTSIYTQKQDEGTGYCLHNLVIYINADTMALSILKGV